MTPDRPFPLIRFYVIASLITIVLVASTTAAVSARLVRTELLEEAKHHAVRVIAHLRKDIEAHFIRPTLELDGAIDLAEEGQFERLDAVVRRIAESFSINAMYIFDRDGSILYSTQREHVGFRVPPENDAFWTATQGHVRSVVLNRGTPLDLAQRPASAALLETYVPVSSLAGGSESGPITNVIETYQNIDALQAEVRRAQVEATAYVIGSSVVLFLALLWVVLAADRFIRRQTEVLVDTNRSLTHLSERLETEVQRRTRDLIQKEKLASLGTLAAGVAHEVNNPLATISGCAQGLIRRLNEHSRGAPLELPAFTQYLRTIDDETDRVKRITRNLLDFSRQRPTLERSTVDVTRLLHDTFELLRVSDELDGIEVSSDPATDPVLFPVDASEMRQLLFNITRNAADSVRERRQRQPGHGGRIRWTVRVETGRLSLQCRDNGCGVAPEHLGEILQPFFTTKPPGKGTGLGLALCHGIVERHGGSLRIESEGRDRGATASIEIPSDTEANGSS
ncbi:MAG: sensor histidine kinase [Planctomycetota bacterium]